MTFRGLTAPDGREVAPMRWESPKAKPVGSARGQLRTLAFDPPLGRPGAAATIRVDYRLHTYNRMQHEQDEYRFWQTVAAVVLLPTTLFALFLVVRFSGANARELDRWARRRRRSIKSANSSKPRSSGIMSSAISSNRA